MEPRNKPGNIKPARGFTLIEILVTVLIIGILASFASVQYYKVVDNQRLTDAEAQIQVIATANQQYYQDNKTYATSLTALISGNYLAQESLTNPYYTLSAGSAANPDIVAEATPLSGSLTSACVDQTNTLHAPCQGAASSETLPQSSQAPSVAPTPPTPPTN